MAKGKKNVFLAFSFFIVAAMLIGVGVGLFAGFYTSVTNPVRKDKENFIQTYCNIDAARLISLYTCTRSSCSTSYRVEMTVEYNNTMNNQMMVTKAYNSYKGNYLSSSSVGDFILTHPVGSVERDCYFNPKNFATVVFNFDQDSSAIGAEVIGAIFMFLGLVCFVSGMVISCKYAHFKKI
eukprot:TRINITY_DN4315_c0_g1_i1.p1 TRINITY_DN4315_c0_g1~~TRINITY_DN4315_c0_g1_i1.p1  ORF type:complete len:180 (-),score=40.60 TRINITY_DN4315_c0_g1_i1:90-629(-)